jgi:hypothetical protein
LIIFCQFLGCYFDVLFVIQLSYIVQELVIGILIIKQYGNEGLRFMKSQTEIISICIRFLAYPESLRSMASFFM